MKDDLSNSLALLRAGQPPADDELLEELSVGMDFITDFWDEKYLREYICAGGSKIKFITGKRGSGKTHFLRVMGLQAQKSNYITVAFSAKDVWVHDFKEIYAQILKSVDIAALLSRCTDKIIEAVGHKASDIPQGVCFADYLSENGLLNPMTKREIRNKLNEFFQRNPMIDNNFALACSFITGGLLGYPTLEEHNREMLLQWLCGEKSVSLPALRKLGLMPSKITKYNARHMLRSLVEIIKMAGYTGLVVTIDDLEILINRGSLESIRYTKLKREDAYESIRELIDEIDTLKSVMFLFAFDKSLIEDEILGLKSYQALWMRIQNEIAAERLNRFTDILDMDALAKQVYTPEIIKQMSQKLANVLNTADSCTATISEPLAEELISRAPFSAVALPLSVNIATMGGTSDD